jgi:hypothetical protein
MIVVCRQDEQHTTDYPRPFPAQADTARGRQKELFHITLFGGVVMKASKDRLI